METMRAHVFHGVGRKAVEQLPMMGDGVNDAQVTTQCR